MIARILLRMAIVATAAWAGLALWVQRPLASVGTLSLIFLTALLAIAALVCVRPRPRTALALYAIGTLSICVWWWTIVPTDNRDWAPDVAQQTQGAVAGDRVTLTNVQLRLEERYRFHAALGNPPLRSDQAAIHRHDRVVLGHAGDRPHAGVVRL